MSASSAGRAWSCLRRRIALILCWILLLQSAPGLAGAVTLRSEPRGWPIVAGKVRAAADWARETVAAAGFASRWVRARLSGAVLLADSFRVAFADDAAQANLPAAPPSPPGFFDAPGRPEKPAVLPATAGGIPVVPGWSLISLPAAPADPRPQTVFANRDASQVFAYDACDPSDPWKLYDPSDPAASDLTTVDESLGLWVDASQAASIPSTASAPASTTIHLCPGWNLIGFPSDNSRPVASALSSIAGQYQRVFGYEASDTADPWELYDVSIPSWANDLQVLRPGHGYWILATAETDLRIVNDGSDFGVEIAQPAQLAEVTEPIAVTGTVRGQSLAEWELRYRSLDGGDWITLGTGTGPVTGAQLGTFDPTLLLNGLYEIELSALAADGNGVSYSTHVVVEGQQKIGNFTLSFVDLEVPLAGIPIQVIRTYDSRDKRSLDFGYGWTLDVRQGSYRNNRKPGEGWRIVDGLLPCQTVQETLPHLTTVRLSDREIYRFKLALTRPAITAGGCFAEAGFAFVDGPVPGATLEIQGNTSVFHGNGTTGVVDSESQEPYEPTSVRLRTRDGRVFDLDLARGVTRLADANGNELQITNSGITHSSGRSIAITRDAKGRITDITDPLDRTIHYDYDTAGDLIAVTDRENNTTRFTYNRTHGLLTIQDPRGIQPLRNEYDDQGRLLRHIDAFGKTIELGHDLANHREVITDRLGHSRSLEYDARGNVVKETDALGNVTTRTFDADDQLLSETDPLGHITFFTYDAGRNLTSVRDPLGNTTRYTYNARGQVLTKTDPRGKTTYNEFDESGNLLRVVDPLGHITAYTYDSLGNLVTRTEFEGAVTIYAYDRHGNLTEHTDALGAMTRFTYDAVGNRLTQTVTRTVADGTKQTLVSRFGFDRQGHPISTSWPDGSTTGTVYNAIGQISEAINALGRRTNFTYDELGRQASTLYPDGTADSRAYDAEGRIVAMTDRGGRVTAFLYDSLGRPTSATLPDGASTTSRYDKAGNLVAFVDARGNTTSYVYDATGRRTHAIDAVGGRVDFQYDEAGNQTAVTDANRLTTGFVYDDLGRKVQTVFPDGTSRQVEYDGAGRRVAETDQDGRTTRFLYDALGRPIEVIDALGQPVVYSYDELGDRISQTDANGYTTLFDYDALGRAIRRVLPDGSAEQLDYDAAGNLTSKRDFAGRKIGFTYGPVNRLEQKLYPDGTVTAFTYTPTGRRATMVDTRGTTRYTYDMRDRLVEMVYPDGRKLTYGWDANSNRTALTAHVAGQSLVTTFTYDALDRLNTVTDPLGRVYNHNYDADGNRIALAYPNGVVTTYTYNTLNRLIELRTRTGLGAVVQQYVYTLASVGNRTRVEEHNGTVRAYVYDALDRLTHEAVIQNGEALYAKVFSYDLVGNRLQQSHSDATGSAITINGTYDTRDRELTRGAQVWTWDINGNLVAKADEALYEWDFENRLQQVKLADGSVVTYTYDADGVKVNTEIRKADGSISKLESLVDTSSPFSQVIAETRDGSLAAYYIRGEDLLALMRPVAPGGWTSRFYHADGLGSIRTLTDEGETVTDSYGFTAFGELLSHIGPDPNPYLFAGEPYDSSSGLYYNRARWMDPEAGRFVSLDPVPAGHLYAYALQNPVNLTDPSGRFAEFGIMSLTLDVSGLMNLVRVLDQAPRQLVVAPVIRMGMQGEEEFSLWIDQQIADANAIFSPQAGIMVQRGETKKRDPWGGKIAPSMVDASLMAAALFGEEHLSRNTIPVFFESTSVAFEEGTSDRGFGICSVDKPAGGGWGAAINRSAIDAYVGMKGHGMGRFHFFAHELAHAIGCLQETRVGLGDRLMNRDYAGPKLTAAEIFWIRKNFDGFKNGGKQEEVPSDPLE
jgi:RHS repeat-associated protein